MIQLPAELQAQFERHSEHYLVKALDTFIEWATEINASDLHFETHATAILLRVRRDGVLESVLSLPQRFAPLIISRLKMLAELDIAEKRLPQDGRFELNKLSGRISTCPTLYGEKVVIRLLPLESRWIPLAEQGMTAGQIKAVADLLESPHGLVIVCGPTGSGKTMTLYALLDLLNSGERNLISIEDPVEMVVPGVNQIQVQEKAGLDFKSILRSLLRQDPDVMMIGEIRDLETAEIAIKAAQTGHLVLSTLHTASSKQALSRLEQLGIPQYLLLESLKLVIAQRLFRKKSLRVDGEFQGREGLFELLTLPEMRYIEDLDLKAAGDLKVKAGLTTEAEVRRVV